MEPGPVEVAPLQPETHSLPAALAAGAVAAAASATPWAVIAVVTGLKIGWVAVGIGFLVGYAVRYFGKGSEPAFQVVGAALSLLGCLAGNLLIACLFASREHQVPLFSVLSILSPSLIVEIMVETFSPMDLLFYGIAVYEGFRFSRAPSPPAAPAPGLSA